MTRPWIVGSFAAALWAAGLIAQQPSPAPGPQTNLPTFREGVELIQLDVSVLDRDRQPIRGLTVADFTLKENGKIRPIVGFTAIDLPDRDVEKAAWMTNVGPDVMTNTFDAERVVLIMMDDWNVDFEPWTAQTARRIGAEIIDRMGPGDTAAVFYTTRRRKGQEFTTDRGLLRAAVDRYLTGQAGQCPAQSCVHDAMTNAGRALMGIRGRRKVLFFISMGSAYRSQSVEDLVQIHNLRPTFDALRKANITVYGMDPAGLEVAPRDRWHTGLHVFSDNTGGRVIADTNAPWDHVRQIFRENSSYYVLAFAPANPKADGQFRKVSVEVARQDLKVSAHPGYFIAKPEKPKNTKATPLQASILGALPATDVPVRVTAAAFARPGQKTAGVTVTTGLDLESLGGGGVVNLLLTAYDDRWNEKGVLRRSETVQSAAAAGEFDLASRLDLAPGRYQVRVGVEAVTTRRVGSAYISVAVPDFAKDRLSLSGVVLARQVAPSASAPIRDLVPVVPTTVRRFSREDRVTSFARIYQAPKTAVNALVTTTILDAMNRPVASEVVTLEPARFAGGASVDLRWDLPLVRLEPGAYLLVIEANTQSVVRREVRFEVR